MKINILFALLCITNFVHSMYQEPKRELPPYYDDTKRIFEHQVLQAIERKLELKKTFRNQPTPANRAVYQQAKVELNFAHENLNNLVNTYKDIQ